MIQDHIHLIQASEQLTDDLPRTSVCPREGTCGFSLFSLAVTQQVAL